MTAQTGVIAMSCPMGSTWRDWDPGTEERLRPPDPEDLARVQAAREAGLGPKLSEIAVSWEVAPDDVRYKPAPGDSHFVSGSPGHVHTEVTVDGHQVHIDRLSANKHSPGRSYVEYRIFVDGMLAGRGGQAGASLGGGGRDLPAVALLGNDRVLTVDGEGVVTLWARY